MVSQLTHLETLECMKIYIIFQVPHARASAEKFRGEGGGQRKKQDRKKHL